MSSVNNEQCKCNFKQVIDSCYIRTCHLWRNILLMYTYLKEFVTLYNLLRSSSPDTKDTAKTERITNAHFMFSVFLILISELIDECCLTDASTLQSFIFILH